jgi:HD-like signal output (HDOD) protein
MSLALITIAVVAAVVLLLFFLRLNRNATPPMARPAAPRAPAAAAVQRQAAAVPEPAEPPPAPAVPAAPPAALLGFYRRQADELDPARRETLITKLRSIPRPPRALHKLISPEFLSRASSTELAELVSAEPVIAAKVMSMVNSPLYQLRTPVATIGQAVTFLGLNSVRAICMRYMLEDSFTPKTPELRQLFNQLWHASAVATELCARLAQKLQLPDAGALLTQLVLSFLGRFASAALLPAELAQRVARMDLLQRSMAEQEFLGLSAAGLTEMLLREWSLPPSLAVDVCAIDAILVTPPHPEDAARDASLALCYLCARLGEQLSLNDTPPDLSRVLNSDSAEFHHLQAYLRLPQLARLPELMQSPDVVRLVQTLRQSQKAEAQVH